MIHSADKTDNYSDWLHRLQLALNSGKLEFAGRREQGQVLCLIEQTNRVPIARTLPQPLTFEAAGGELRVVRGSHSIRLAGDDLVSVLDPVSVDGVQRLRVIEARAEPGHLAHYVAVPFLWREPTNTLDDFLIVLQVLL